MAIEQAIHDSMEYRVVLVEPDRREVLVQGLAGDSSLPRIRVPLCSRRAQELLTGIYAEWGLCAFVVDYVATMRSHGASSPR